jgi:hypothetical protein
MFISALFYYKKSYKKDLYFNKVKVHFNFVKILELFIMAEKNNNKMVFYHCSNCGGSNLIQLSIETVQCFHCSTTYNLNNDSNKKLLLDLIDFKMDKTIDNYKIDSNIRILRDVDRVDTKQFN